jgi:hypothetical protein
VPLVQRVKGIGAVARVRPVRQVTDDATAVLPVADPLAGVVDHGHPQVRQRSLGRANGRPPPVGRRERVLHHVLGRGQVVDQQARQPDQTAAVHEEKCCQRVVGTLSREAVPTSPDAARPRRRTGRSGRLHANQTPRGGGMVTPITG